MPEITDITQSLRALIDEYSNSLTRVEAEKDLMKAIAERAEKELSIPAGPFRKLALDVHRDAIALARESMRDMLELYDTIEPEED